MWHLPLSARFCAGGLLEDVFRTIRDFYPTFFTIYQTAIFFGRTSITLFRLPGGNKRSARAYYGLCFMEVIGFLTMLAQSISMTRALPAAYPAPDPDMAVRFSPVVIGTIIFGMGLCGGLGLSNTYWRVSQKPLPHGVWKAWDHSRLVTRQEGLMVPQLSPGAEEGNHFFQRERPQLRLRASMPSIRMCQTERVKNHFSRKEETAMREFLISTIALPDTVAIMLASIVSLWLQPKLCGLQAAGGRELCIGGAA
jgi:hypothetical protein